MSCSCSFPCRESFFYKDQHLIRIKHVGFNVTQMRAESFGQTLKVQNVSQAKKHKGYKNQMLVHHSCSPEIRRQTGALSSKLPQSWPVWCFSIQNTSSLVEEIEYRFLQGFFCIFLVSLLQPLVGVFPISRLVVVAYYWWTDWWSPFVIVL